MVIQVNDVQVLSVRDNGTVKEVPKCARDILGYRSEPDAVERQDASTDEVIQAVLERLGNPAKQADGHYVDGQGNRYVLQPVVSRIGEMDVEIGVGIDDFRCMEEADALMEFLKTRFPTLSIDCESSSEEWVEVGKNADPVEKERIKREVQNAIREFVRWRDRLAPRERKTAAHDVVAEQVSLHRFARISSVRTLITSDRLNDEGIRRMVLALADFGLDRIDWDTAYDRVVAFERAERGKPDLPTGAKPDAAEEAVPHSQPAAAQATT